MSCINPLEAALNATHVFPETAIASINISEPALQAEKNTGRNVVADWNFTWSAMLIDGLIMAGATNIVMCPGAQAAPLMMASRANPKAKISIIIDERSAAFHALGQARATGVPTMVICTSGSAVGQMYPAIMEASAVLAPLIVLAADRAPERQDSCAAQAIDQTKVFGSQVRASHHLPAPDDSIESLTSIAARIVEQSLFPTPGPVFVNQPFREPLYAASLRKHERASRRTPLIARPLLMARADDVQQIADRISGRPGLILCGSREADPDLAVAIGELASAIDCPIVADPLSGLRFGPRDQRRLFSRADSLPRSKAFADRCHPDWIITLRGPAVSQGFFSWLEDVGLTDYIVVEDSTRWPDPIRRATRMVRADPAGFCRDLARRVKPAPSDWADRFARYECLIDDMIRRKGGPHLWEAPIIERLIRAVPDQGILFSGNSMSVRDFDTFSGTSSKPFRLLANRGVNGIDGSIATLLGIAAHNDRGTLAMIGDVAFCHDLGSLQIANGLDVLMVVLNNGGGAIFDYQGAIHTRDYLDFLAPPSVDMSSAAKACGWRHWRAATPEEFDGALDAAQSVNGCRMIEAVIDRKTSVARHQAYWAAIRDLPSNVDAAE